MRGRLGWVALAAAAAALAGCGGDENRGALTAEEERMLDNAASMLDDNMIDASPDSLVADEAELEAIEEPGNDVGNGQ